MKKLGLLEVLEGIEDSRRERSVWYPLHEVLFIFIASDKQFKCLLDVVSLDKVIVSALCS